MVLAYVNYQASHQREIEHSLLRDLTHAQRKSVSELAMAAKV